MVLLRAAESQKKIMQWLLASVREMLECVIGRDSAGSGGLVEEGSWKAN
jgi:hypothetical protein